MAVIKVAQVPVAYIEVRFLAHATEDENKVLEAVKRILPSQHVDEIKFKRQSLKGHHGNPIIFFETKIRKKSVVGDIVENLASNLNSIDKEKLGKKIELHIDGRSLYLRLDKQAAYQGEYKLCNADPIRIRIQFKERRMENIAEKCKEIGLTT